jgi:histidyl-tRNA synthetase
MYVENVKGTRDIPPEEMLVREGLLERLRLVFRKFGYQPLETSILELQEVLDAKAGAGADADATKETYRLTDQGGRKIGLRFELTLSFARYVGMNPNLRMPFKRYEIGPVFRDGPIKLGRYRQFWQCDVDAVGCKDMIVDSEILLLALEAFDALGIEAILEVNNRKILKGLIEDAGIDVKMADSAIISIDKLQKAGREGVAAELAGKGIPDNKIQALLDAFTIEGSADEKLSRLKSSMQSQTGKEGIREMEDVFSSIPEESKKNIEFNITLARGLGYYTGTIFEGFAKDSPIKSSICGGGRYDRMVQELLQNEKEYPCVGISFGLDVISDVLKARTEKFRQTDLQAYVIPIKTAAESFGMLMKLRKLGVCADMDFLQRPISRNLEYAGNAGIPYVIIIGRKELDGGTVNLRDMRSGKEEALNIEEAAKNILQGCQ